MSIKKGNLLYILLSADRFFLVPSDQELPTGGFTVVSLEGEEREVDEGALAPFEVSEKQAKAHLHAQAEQAIATVADRISRALGLGDDEDGKRTDLRRVAEQLGLSQADLRSDPEATRAALKRFADDAQAIVAVVATGDTNDFQAARERLAARGLDLGETLDEIPGYLRLIQQLDQQSVANAATSGLRTLTDAIKGDQALNGQQIDELIARLEQELEPLIVMNREQEEQQQKEYRRSATSAISDALRAAGITPLTSTETNNKPPT